MADIVANAGNVSRQTFPFMKLPPELRLVVYDFAMRSYLEDIERTKFLQCGPPKVGVSPETRNKWREAKMLEMAELRRRRKSKAAPYLGALALLHTNRIVYWESFDTMGDLVERCRKANFAFMWKAWKAVLGRNSQTADLLSYEHNKLMAVWSHMKMVSDSFSNAHTRKFSNDFYVNLHGALHGQAIQSAPSTTDSDRSTESAAEISRGATLVAAVKYFPGICASIQRRLENGDGVRTSFKAEVKLRADWEITNDEVAIMIKGVAALGASLKNIRGPDCDKRFRQFRVVKRKSRPKGYRSVTSCDPPRTWLSTDEMDTGP